MTDITIVDEAGEAVKQEEPREVGHPDTQVVAEGVLLQEQIGQLFDLRPNELSQFRPKINTLIDYAKSKTEDHSPEGLKWALRALALKLGTPPMGEKLINYMTRFAALSAQKSKLDEELGKYNANG